MEKLLTGAAAAVFVLTSAAQAAETVDGPRVHWNYSDWGTSRAVTTLIENLGPWLSDRTGGKFTVQVHWGTLSQPRAVLDGLSLGAFEAGSFCASYYPAKLPAHTGLDLPFLPISTLEQLRHVSHDYYAGPVPEKEVAKWNSRFFASSLLPLYEVVGKGKPPKSLDDWKGMRIRAIGPQGKAMEKLGAVPTSVPGPEVYTSMDRGLLDSVSFPYYAHESYRTFELGDWFTNHLAVGSIACGNLINVDAYNGLPPQYKALLDEFLESDKGYTAQYAALYASDKKAPVDFKAHGLSEVLIDPAERAEFERIGGKPVWAEWATKMSEDHGYDGQALLDELLTLAKQHDGVAH